MTLRSKAAEVNLQPKIKAYNWQNIKIVSNEIMSEVILKTHIKYDDT